MSPPTHFRLTRNDLLNMDLDGLRSLRPEDCPPLDADSMSHIFRTCDALWLHSGDPADPHVELTSGKCSNGFVDTLRVLRYTNLCRLMADNLGELLCNYLRANSIEQPWPAPEHWTIGSDHAGAAISHALAEKFGMQHDFTEKGPDGSQVWKRFIVQPNEYVLQCEELITTIKTLKAVRQGVRTGNPTPVAFFPCALTIVHRSDIYEIEGAPILYLVHYDIKTWDGPEVCPLCQAGSKRLRAKHHWNELTKKAA